MILPDYLPAQRTLGAASAVLFAATMVAVAAGRLELLPMDTWVVFLSGAVSAVWFAAVGWTMPMLRYGPAGQGRLTWAVVFAGWLQLVPAIAFESVQIPEAVHTATVGLVVLAAVAWADGFRGVR